MPVAVYMPTLMKAALHCAAGVAFCEARPLTACVAGPFDEAETDTRLQLMDPPQAAFLSKKMDSRSVIHTLSVRFISSVTKCMPRGS